MSRPHGFADWKQQAATQRLRQQAPVMRKAGWDITDVSGRNKAHTTIWTISPPELVRIDTSLGSPTRDFGSEGEMASQASQESGQSRYEADSKEVKL